MYNKEKTSKLISYWLRHNPAEGDLTTDDFGWVATDDLLAALKSKGQETTLQALQELNVSFDKIRWEFSGQTDFIRATHGHSIPVLLDDKSEEPPVLIYHGTAAKSLENILRSGLMPMQRQFVHCSASIETAIEVGKRHGKAIVIEIDAESLFKKGAQFYKTSENVWLTNGVSIEFLTFKPWEVVDEGEKSGLLKQLKTELGSEHILFNQITNLELILRRHDRDDCLFIDSESKAIHEVHLTWSKHRESDSKWPATRSYQSITEWVNNSLVKDQGDWYNF